MAEYLQDKLTTGLGIRSVHSGPVPQGASHQCQLTFPYTEAESGP